MTFSMKSSFKRLIALGIAGVVSASTAFAEFADMPNDWRTTAIQNAVKNGIISGYAEDNTVRADGNITRAEMASIIVRAMGATEGTDISEFSDIQGHWAYDTFKKAVYMNAFSGSDGMLNPNNNITFQECFTVLSRVFGLHYNMDDTTIEKELSQYSDASSVADWAKIYYAAVLSGGYWDGGQQKLLRGNEYITRGEFAVVMDKLVQTYVDEPTELKGNIFGNVLIRKDGVKLDGAKIDGNLYIADGVSSSGITIKDTEISKALVVRGCKLMENTKPGEVFAPSVKAFTCYLIGPGSAISPADLEMKIEGYSAKGTTVFAVLGQTTQVN